jgi:hypothetical protein
VRHARQRVSEVLGQRWQWSSRFGQYITCWDNRGTHGRQLGCTQRWCTHQYRHNNYDHYNNDYNDYNDYNDDDNHDNGCTNNDNFDNNDINLNNDVNFYDHNGCTTNNNFDNDRTNNNIDDFINDTSAHSCATAHHQRIRQQHTRVKSRSETATQQTWCAVARWRFGVVRGVPRVKLPQSRQPAHGETVAICLYLSIGPRPWAGGHLKHSVLPVISGSEHYC